MSIKFLLCMAFLFIAKGAVLPDGSYYIHSLLTPDQGLQTVGLASRDSNLIKNMQFSAGNIRQIYNVVAVGADYKITRANCAKTGISVSTDPTDFQLRYSGFDSSNPTYSLWTIEEHASTSSNVAILMDDRVFTIKNKNNNRCVGLTNPSPGTVMTHQVCAGDEPQRFKFLTVVL